MQEIYVLNFLLFIFVLTENDFGYDSVKFTRRRAELKPQISDLHSHYQIYTSKSDTWQNCVVLILEKDGESDFHCREMHFKCFAFMFIYYISDWRDNINVFTSRNAQDSYIIKKH